MIDHVLHTGYGRRALRDLARHVGAPASLDAVLEARRALGPAAAVKLLTQHRVAALLVDTGYPPEAMSLAEMTHLLPSAIHEVFRIETCAQRLVALGLEYDAFLDRFRQELEAAATRCVAFKSIVAYRSGLAVTSWSRAEATHAYDDVRDRVARGGTARLTEKPLLDTLVELALDVARATGRPIQIHAGFGDPDIDLAHANPVLLRRVLEDARWASVRIVLLHMAYPYFREASFLAATYPNVYLDLSLALPFLGAGATGPLIEILSLAPATKVLYGSDVSALPELFAFAADWARSSIGHALGWLVDHGEVSADDARQIGRRILAANATAVYRLGASKAPRSPDGDDRPSTVEAGNGQGRPKPVGP